MGLLDSLAQGLKSAGGTLNPAVYQDNAQEQLQAKQQQTQMQNAMLGHVIQAIQNGSMAAPEGSPFQASPQAQAAKQALDVKSRQDALSQRILGNEQVQALLADPTPTNLKKVGALFVQNGLPIPAHIKDLEPKVQFAPASSTPYVDGVAQTPIPDKPKTGTPGTVRKIQVGTEEVTQELQADGTYKEVGRGPKFARQVAPVVHVGTGGQQGELDPAAVRDLAIQSLYDPNALSGYRRDPKMMARIANDRIKVMRETGVTSEDVVSGRAGFKADTGSLNKLTPMYDAVVAFEKTAVRNGDRLIELADKVDASGVPVIEKWIRAGRQATGDADVSKFNAQLQIYRTEAAKILTNPNLSGQLTDSARHEIEGFMQPGASAKQIKEVVNLLKNDFENRKVTLEDQIGSIRARMRGRVSPGGEQPAPAAAPSGKTVIKFDAQGNQIP